MQADPRLDRAKAQPIMDVVHRLGISGLKRAGVEWVGPCPVCGDGGKRDANRYAVNPNKGVFICRQCPASGDVIGLVMHALACDFKSALQYLEGDADVQISPEEQAERDRKHAEEKEAREKRAAIERQRAIDMAVEIWGQGHPIEGSAVEAYLARRGIQIGDLPGLIQSNLRFHPALRYTIPKEGGGFEVVHEGPAMLAAVFPARGGMTAVHRTWLDLSQPKGKAKICARGQDWPAKKILGSKKGGIIPLVRAGKGRGGRLVMGEGIETTLTAAVAESRDDTDYWAGVDLGNMAGRRILTGKGMKFAGVPDLSDRDAFVPPEWVCELVFIQDGDSEPKSTRAKLLSGLRRAAHFHPGLTCKIVHAGEGRDLNDILLEGDGDD